MKLTLSGTSKRKHDLQLQLWQQIGQASWKASSGILGYLHILTQIITITTSIATYRQGKNLVQLHERQLKHHPLVKLKC